VVKEAIAREEELERLRAERELAESVSEVRRTRSAGLALKEAEESDLPPAADEVSGLGGWRGAKPLGHDSGRTPKGGGVRR